MITDHQFVGLRQWGIYVPADKPCQHQGCGMPKSQHIHMCSSVLTVKGESFACDLATPHDGWGHSNKTAEAVWQ